MRIEHLFDILAVVSEVLRSPVDPATLPDAALEERLAGAFAAMEASHAEAVGLLAEVARRGSWEVSEKRTMATWLAGLVPSLGLPAAGGEVRVASVAVAHGPVESALAAGSITVGHAAAMAAVRNPRTAAVMERDESLLVGLASQLTIDEFTTATRQWKVHADPQGSAPDDPAHNRLSIVPVGGRFRLSGDLDALSGAALHKAVEDQVGRRYRAEGEQERASTAPNARRAAALLDLATAGAEHPADGPIRSRPSVSVVVPLDALDDESQDRLLELPNGGWVGRDALRFLTCDAAISRVILGPEGRPLDVGREHRLPTPHQRRAVLARDRGCAVEGCDAKPWLCEIHHLIHWLEHGPTDIDNLAMVCRWHHRKAHTTGWHRGRDPDGTIRCRPTDQHHRTLAA